MVIKMLLEISTAFSNIISPVRHDCQAKFVMRIDLKYFERAKAAYWDGRNDVGERVASGVYFYRFITPTFQRTKRMVILK